MKAFKRTIQALSRWAVAVALLPLLYVLVRKIFHMVGIVMGEGFSSWWLYAAGGLAYLGIERLVARPMWLYVVGHELTHAVSGLMSGAKIYSMKAGSKGGEVQLSKSNAFIALSPYVVPFYTVVVVGFYVAARRWANVESVVPTFQVLLGASLAFHFSLTFSAFHRHQSDLKVLGFFLSGVLIAIGNALILALLGVSLFTKTPTLRKFMTETGRETFMIWQQGLRFANKSTGLTPPVAQKTPKDRNRWTR